MARRTKEEALATRDRILDAAEQVFFEKGVSHTSLADIAQQAGVTRGAIYWHFENKAALFDAMLQRVFLPIDELKQVGPEPLADPLGKLREVMAWCLLGVERDPQLRRVFSILFLKCEYVADMGPLLKQRSDGIRTALGNIATDLQQSIARGQLPADLDIVRAAHHVHACINGFIRDMLMVPEDIDAEIEAEPFIDACLDTLRLSPAMRLKR